jgi:transcriptional regulator with XRE-family HTH domain
MSTASAPNDFAQRLRELLKQRGLSNTQFAAQLEVSENSVSSWTTGKYRPGHVRGEKIAAALGMTMDELHGKGPPVPATPAVAPSPPPQATTAIAPTPTSTHPEAQRIVRELAALDLDGALDSIRQATPPLLGILAAARRHVRDG